MTVLTAVHNTAQEQSFHQTIIADQKFQNWWKYCVIINHNIPTSCTVNRSQLIWACGWQSYVDHKRPYDQLHIQHMQTNRDTDCQWIYIDQCVFVEWWVWSLFEIVGLQDIATVAIAQKPTLIELHRPICSISNSKWTVTDEWYGFIQIKHFCTDYNDSWDLHTITLSQLCNISVWCSCFSSRQ